MTRERAAHADALIVEATNAMLLAKQRGSGRCEFFEEESRVAFARRGQDETALRRALDRGELRLAYQPQVLLANDRIIAVEALLRWDHPERGLVTPMEFIPLAEQTGLIVPVGAWVLEEACREARRWRDRFPEHPPLTVAVNVSGRQFEAELASSVRAAISEADIEPTTLCLELTESTIMRDVDATIGIL